MKEPINPEGSFSQSDIRKNYENERDTILVIDDEFGPRESIRIILKNKYNVITAESGDKGIEIVKSQKVDLIILDLKMPGKTGIETLAEIRKYDENVPVIILTGYGDMESAQKAMHYGVFDFVSKPFGIYELEELVANAIKKGKIKRETEKIKEELNSLREKLTKRLEEVEHLATIGQISTEILHEVNNLLTVIYGYTQLLNQEINSNQINSNYISILEKEIKRCKNIAQEILNLTRNEFKEEELEINLLIKNLIEFLSSSNLCQNVNFILNIEQQPLILKGSRNHLHQAILNVFLNSIQTIKKEGKGVIEVSTEKKENYILISIKDNGQGIPEEVIKKVKDPFFTTKEKGLGLHLTTKIIRKHKGDFEIKSEIGKGTEFIIKLPLP